MGNGTGMSIMLPSGPRSLPVTLNTDHHNSIRGRVTNSDSELRLMNEHPAIMMDSEETVPLRQAVSPVRMFSIRLEESDGDFFPEIPRQHNSSPLHSSLLGNPVCHPEQEDFAAISPTLVMAAAEPHLSLDPDKPCCDAAVGGHSSLASANSRLSVSETLCKSNR